MPLVPRNGFSKLVCAILPIVKAWSATTAGPSASMSAVGYIVSDRTIMGYLRNNSIFTFGQVDKAKPSATFREILDAMWLFNDKFERALSEFNEIKAGQKG
ncbi:MAG TPA: hypothetical protein VF913_21670 [Xanthobacteraceae bacterium]